MTKMEYASESEITWIRRDSKWSWQLTAAGQNRPSEALPRRSHFGSGSSRWNGLGFTSQAAAYRFTSSRDHSDWLWFHRYGRSGNKGRRGEFSHQTNGTLYPRGNVTPRPRESPNSPKGTRQQDPARLRSPRSVCRSEHGHKAIGLRGPKGFSLGEPCFH